MYFEDYVLLDAFYMTLITVSTVGYKEVQPLSDSGKLFTSFLILSSFGTFAYAASSIGVGILSGKYRYYFKNYRLEQEIQKLIELRNINVETAAPACVTQLVENIESI